MLIPQITLTTSRNHAIFANELRSGKTAAAGSTRSVRFATIVRSEIVGYQKHDTNGHPEQSLNPIPCLDSLKRRYAKEEHEHSEVRTKFYFFHGIAFPLRFQPDGCAGNLAGCLKISSPTRCSQRYLHGDKRNEYAIGINAFKVANYGRRGKSCELSRNRV